MFYEALPAGVTTKTVYIHDERKIHANALCGIHLNRLKSQDLRFLAEELRRAALVLARTHHPASEALRYQLYTEAYARFERWAEPCALVPRSLRERNVLKALVYRADALVKLRPIRF